MATKEVRAALLLQTCFEILRDRGVRVPKREVYAEVAQRVDLGDAEQATGRDGVPRWVTYAGYHTSVAASVGLVVKMDTHWSITEAGLAALELHPSAEALLEYLWERHREIHAGRQRAHERLGVGLVSIVDALGRVPRAAWTAFEDLAALAGATVDEVVDLLIEGEAIPGSHRVLTADGELPLPGMVHPSHRGSDLRARLMAEGVEFYGVRAGPDQRVPAEILRGTFVDRTIGRRAWLMHASAGVDRWLDGGFVSLDASLLPSTVDSQTSAAVLRRVVSDAYQHLSYATRERVVGGVDAFVRRMRAGDLVLAIANEPSVHLGVIDGAAVFTEAEHQRATLRRPVRWLSRSRPFSTAGLPAPLPSLIRTNADVVDLTGGLTAVESLLDPAGGRRSAPAGAVLPPPPAELARELLLDEVWLSGVVDLLRQRHQIVLFGPPGTGKTHLALSLADRLVDPRAMAVVQLHPGYTYADFVEGFRPHATEDGPERLHLRAGPLRRLADEAREHPDAPYLLIIDEINRGDLASIFGEVYLLLEYRNRPISLPNSQDNGFTLPPNLYLIGTMNGDDQAAVPIDAGLRRRFAFVEMHPSRPPVLGLLRRWLGRQGFDPTAADLFDRLNELVAPTGHTIGPSYLMRPDVYARPDGLDLVWRHDILPLLADRHRGDGVDVEARYGLSTLRASLTVRR